ncbi:MAG: hypothetical protein IKV32_02015 [Muribaculaceae bacterium]|nr:hypothetical protein [Muribaculaceae bacterium]
MKNVIILLLSVIALSSCGGGAGTCTIAQVEELMALSNYQSAQKLCDKIIDGKNLEEIPVVELCQLSLVYVKLSEQMNEVENMAKATKCYHTASLMNADSVSAYISELPIEEIQHAEMLRRLSEMIDAPRDYSDHEEEADSCDGDCANCQREVCIANETTE